MSDPFDAYHQWLGIPPEEQPPNHYRLLGITALENDPGVIEHAADRQMAHLRTFQGGKHAALSQRLLNEVAAAKICLLNPQKKAEYDQRLQGEFEAQGPQAAEMIDPDLAGLISGAAATPARHGHRATTARQVPRWLVPAAVGALVLVSLVVAGIAFYSNSDSPPAENRVSSTPAGSSTAHATSTDSTPAAAGGQTEPAIAQSEGSQGTERLVSPAAMASAAPAPGKQTEPVASASPGPAESESKLAAGSSPKPTADAPPPKAEAAVKEPPQAEPKLERLPIPDADSQQQVTAQLEDIYKLSQQTTPEAKLAAAKELVKVAASADDKPDERFVLLRRAAELAAEAGDAALMFDSLDTMGEHFDLDTLAAKQKMLLKFAEGAKTTAALESLMSVSSKFTSQAAGEHRFDLASEVAAAINRACQRSAAGRDLRKRAAEQRKEVERRRKEWLPMEEAMATLKEKPDDPEANLVIGRGLAFLDGDWDRGLKHLAKGSDAPLKSLARQDIESPPTAAEGQVERGDAWYELGESTKGSDRDAILLRAGQWYESALTQLPTGLARLKVEKRLAQIAGIQRRDSSVDATSHTPAAPLAGPWTDLLTAADPARNAIDGKWKRNGGALALEGGGRIVLPLVVQGDYDLEFEFTRTTGDSAVYAVLPVGATACDLILNGWKNTTSGLECVGFRRADANPTRMAPAPIINGHKHLVAVRVRISRDVAWFQVYFDGRRYLRWSGNMGLLHPAVGTTEPRCIGLGAIQSTTFHAARLRSTASEPVGASGPAPRPGTQTTAARPVPGVVIVKAHYGPRDVSNLLRWALERDPFAPVQADHDFTSDPNPGWRKTFGVTFRVGNEEKSVGLQEWEVATIPALPPEGLSLPGASKPFKILAARYGAGLRWMDVTPAIRQLVADPTRPFGFTAAQAGGDPRPGAAKSVAVWFDYLGKRYVRVLREGKCVLLP